MYYFVLQLLISLLFFGTLNNAKASLLVNNNDISGAGVYFGIASEAGTTRTTTVTEDIDSNKISSSSGWVGTMFYPVFFGGMIYPLGDNNYVGIETEIKITHNGALVDGFFLLGREFLALKMNNILPMIYVGGGPASIAGNNTGILFGFKLTGGVKIPIAINESDSFSLVLGLAGDYYQLWDVERRLSDITKLQAVVGRVSIAIKFNPWA